MKTSVAHTWKSLTSKLHPPLPLSSRDTQRLRSLLNASFKQQLDREHPADSSSNEHYANLHLQSILTNPLFDAKPQTRASSTSKSQFGGMRLGQLQTHMKRPMDAFKKRVSQGTADLETAKIFLNIQFRDCLASAAATPREAMQSSGAASTMLQWLWSSGREDTGEFLRDRKFMSLLVRFIVADRQHSQILRWLHRYHSPETPFSSLHGLDTCGMQGNLLASLIKQEIFSGDGLESAITLFLRTIGSLRSSGSSKKSMQCSAIMTARSLAAAMLRLSSAAEPKPSNFRPFLEMMREFHLGPQLYAELCICFQEHPDPKPTLTFFQNIPAQAIVNASVKRRPHMIFLGLRAAELFLQDGRHTEALWIMEFLQTNFAQELGSPLPQDRKAIFSNDPKKMLRREEESLHLLDTLAAQ